MIRPQFLMAPLLLTAACSATLEQKPPLPEPIREAAEGLDERREPVQRGPLGARRVPQDPVTLPPQGR
jgi:hypothetical protein